MDKGKPRVSIGLPVFNGERYLRQALDSILAQTYGDFELIISDNASIDKTQNICLEYAAKDRRLRYYRNRRNIGAAANYNRVFLLSSGEYFKWAAHDDVLAPEFLEKCVHVLDSDSSIVLCHSKVARIDENGVLVENYDDETLSNLCSWKPHERFRDYLFISRAPPWAIMGVVRAGALAKTPLHGCHIGSDSNLLAELSLMGRIYEIQEHLFFRREHPQAYSNVYGSITGIHDYRRQLSWWGGNKKNFLLVLPRWMNCLEFFRSLNRVPLKFSERFLCYREIGRWLLKDRKRMIYELFNEFQLWRIRLHYGQAKKGVSKSS